MVVAAPTLRPVASFYQLEFERPLREIERQLEEGEARLAALRSSALPASDAAPTQAPLPDADAGAEIARLEADAAELRDRHGRTLVQLYSNLTPWDVVRVARHPDRPQGRDYIRALCRDFCELQGDRRFGDDPAIVTGFGRIDSIKCLVVAHHKGKTTQEKIACHFGCAHPEGYRKALKNMKLAEKFGLPVVTLVDTPGAYPGLGAEQRGQAEAIAVNLREMSRLRTPIVSVVIGEGGSGGALGIAVADRVAMLEHAWYSVISPEGCAAILWKQANEQTNSAAAEALRLTAKDNLALGIVDAVIPEPLGGAHRDPGGAAELLKGWIVAQLQALRGASADELVASRYARFRRLGTFTESAEPAAAAAG